MISESIIKVKRECINEMCTVKFVNWMQKKKRCRIGKVLKRGTSFSWWEYRSQCVNKWSLYLMNIYRQLCNKKKKVVNVLSASIYVV